MKKVSYRGNPDMKNRGMVRYNDLYGAERGN